MKTTKQFIANSIDTVVAQSGTTPVGRKEVASIVSQMLAEARINGLVDGPDVRNEVKAFMAARDNTTRSAKVDLKAWQAVTDYREGKILLTKKHLQWLNTAMPVGAEDRGKLILVKHMIDVQVMGKITERAQHVEEAEKSLQEYREVGTNYIALLEAEGKRSAAELLPGI